MAKTVRLYPVPGAYIAGVPAVVTDASAEEAQRLLAYTPPAFTTDPPEVASGEPEDPPDGGAADPPEV
jgi:hypothetical protein